MKISNRKRHNVYLEDDLWEFASGNAYNLSAAAYIRKLLLEEQKMKATIAGYYVRGETVYRVVSLPNNRGIRGEVFNRDLSDWKPVNPVEAQFYGRRISEEQAWKIIHREYSQASTTSSGKR
jgi:hypothetical protein